MDWFSRQQQGMSSRCAGPAQHQKGRAKQQGKTGAVGHSGAFRGGSRAACVKAGRSAPLQIEEVQNLEERV